MQLGQLLPTVNPAIYPDQSRLKCENFYFNAGNLTGVWGIYALSTIPLLLGFVFRWRPARWIGLSIFTLAFLTHTFAVGLRWFADERMSFYVGRRTIHSDSTIWTERMDYRLSNRWGVEVEYQEDTKEGKGLRTLLSLYRRAHDYTLALEITSDKQGNNTSVGFAIYPNDLQSGHDDPFSKRRPLDYDALKWYR